MRDDFRIGFGFKFVSFFAQHIFQGQIIFDNAVMDDDDLARSDRDADARFPRSVARASPSAYARCRNFRPEDSGESLLRDFAVCLRRDAVEMIALSSTTAMPAESYPRYSSFRKPSMISGTTCLFPTYPTIPHIVLLLKEILRNYFARAFCTNHHARAKNTIFVKIYAGLTFTF